MSDIWTTLEKELAINGIELIDNKICRVLENNKLRTKSLLLHIKDVDREISRNRLALEETLENMNALIQEADHDNNIHYLDIKTQNLFVHSIKSLSLALRTYLEKYNFKYKELTVADMYRQVRLFLNKDSASLGKHVILGIPDYKLTMDWLVRNLNKLSYIKRLLLIAMKGQNRIEKYFVKIARGVQGPWANLDLPMEERAFEWKDIEEEVRGRDRDIRKQRRYRMGLDGYNDYSKKAGEGFYWVEMNNEPYLWSDRATNSPYPGRSSFTA